FRVPLSGLEGTDDVQLRFDGRLQSCAFQLAFATRDENGTVSAVVPIDIEPDLAAPPVRTPTPTPTRTPTPTPTVTPRPQSCCVPGALAGGSCDRSACAQCVCGADPFCCTSNWDQDCVDGAFASQCAAACLCGTCANPIPLPTILPATLSGRTSGLSNYAGMC